MKGSLGAPAGRDRHFDGLRGIAATVVVFEHISALLPVGNWTAGTGLAAGLATSLVNLPFRSGALAVYVFFVISGVVISNAARDKPWPLSLIARYLRLTIPMVAASLLAWILLKNFPAEMPAISRFNYNHWTSTNYQDGAPPFVEALREPIYGVYYTGMRYINPVLWTMRMELYGSLGILTYYRFVPKRQRLNGQLLIALVLTLLGHWRYVAFFLGAAIFEINRARPISQRLNRSLPAILLALALAVIGGVPQMPVWNAELSASACFPVDVSTLIYTAASTLVVIGVMVSSTGKNLLESPVPQFLGRISYSLYLTHMPLLLTAFAALYLLMGQPPSPIRLAGWTILFASSAITIAWWMTILIDEPIMRFVKVKKRGKVGAAPVIV